MRYILLIAVTLAFAFGSSAASSVELRSAKDAATNAPAADVEGAIIRGDRAYAKKNYEFVQESRNSVSVIKTANNTRLQTGTLSCVSSSRCDAALVANRLEARCRATASRCSFIGIPGGVLAP